MLTILAVIYVVFISLGLPDSLFGVAWPVVHTELGVEESFASVFSIIVGCCTGGVSVISGILIRKLGTARVTLVSVLITALGLLGISLSPNITLMILFSVILGYGAGAIDTGLNNFVSLYYSARHMNWLHCFWGVGVTVSPVIMSFFLSEDNQWRGGYRIVALLQLATALLVLVFFRRWRNIEKGSEAHTGQTASESGKITDVLKIRGVLTGVLSLGAYCSMEFLLGTWGATYAVNVFAASPEVAAKWVSLYYGGIMAGRLVAGIISVKVSDSNMIRGGIAISFFGILVLLLPLGSLSLIGLFLLGTGFGPIFPNVLHSIPERFGKRLSADITGYHMGGAYAIGFALQLIYGYTATAVGFEITPFVLLGLCVLLLLLNEVTERRASGNRL